MCSMTNTEQNSVNVNTDIRSSLCVYLGDAVVHSGLAVIPTGFGLIGRLHVLGSSLLESLKHIFGGCRGCRGCWGGGG